MIEQNAARGLVIAAPRSSSGKTTLTLGLLRAFARRGVRVAGLKCGPDYIDPAFHTVAAGRAGVNLDAWSMSPGLVAALAKQSTADAELVLCEGLMGLFDGVPAALGRSGSTADIAAATGWPVLLILDVSGQSQSAAAIVKGCATYDPRPDAQQSDHFMSHTVRILQGFAERHIATTLAMNRSRLRKCL